MMLQLLICNPQQYNSMASKKQDIQFFENDNIFLEAQIEQDYSFFQDINMEDKIIQDFNISEDSSLNLNISSENDQFSGRNPLFELKTMPFKKQLKLFLSHLRKSILKSNIVPKYFLPIFTEKINQILQGKRSGRNIDISHFIQLWILIQNLDKKVRDFKKKIITIIDSIKISFKRCQKEKKKKIRQISERILECISNYQLHDRELNQFIEELWGPIIKRKDFLKLEEKIQGMVDRTKDWIISNMSVIGTIDNENL